MKFCRTYPCEKSEYGAKGTPFMRVSQERHSGKILETFLLGISYLGHCKRH